MLKHRSQKTKNPFRVSSTEVEKSLKLPWSICQDFPLIIKFPFAVANFPTIHIFSREVLLVVKKKKKKKSSRSREKCQVVSS